MWNRFLNAALSALLLGIGLLPGMVAGAENHENDASLMRLVAEKRQVSLDALRTWKGARKRTVTEFTPEGEAFVRIESDMHFAFDAERNATIWNSETTFHGTGPGESDIRSIDGALRMDSRRYWLSVEPERPNRVCYITFDDGGREHLGTGFEVIDQFDRLRDDLFKVYEAYDRYLQNENTSAFLRREGNLVIRGMARPDGFLNQWTYDLDKGGNLVEYIGRYPEKLSEVVRETDYVLQGGTWVPTIMSSTSLTDGQIVQKEEITFSNESVNVPLNDSDFTLESIGLRPGDVVSDQRTGLEYIYDGSVADDTFMGNFAAAEGINLVQDASQPETQPQAPSTSEQPTTDADTRSLQEKQPEKAHRTSRDVLLIIAVVLLVLTGFLFLRKRGRENNASQN